MLNATWLETFAMVCETRNYTRAAERLHMTQPGVSQHIRKLEEQVGLPLVRRAGKTFLLTEAGGAILRLAEARLEAERRVLAALQPEDPDRGELRLACSGSMALLLYPYLIARMQGRDALTVHLEAAPQSSIWSGLLRGEYVLAVIHDAPQHPRVETERIGTEELCLVLPAGTPEPSMQTLESLGLIAHPDAFRYADVVLGRNFPEGFAGADRLRVRSAINQIGQILDPVAHGLGYTLLPRSAVDAFPRPDRLMVATLPHPTRQDLFLAWPSGDLPLQYRPVAAHLRELARAR